VSLSPCEGCGDAERVGDFDGVRLERRLRARLSSARGFGDRERDSLPEGWLSDSTMVVE
jgi:hypothetical protein